MMNHNRQNRQLLSLIATGAVGGLASVASMASAGEPFLVNVSGSTAQDSFFKAPASTIDYIDADNNGHSIKKDGAVQQLASGIAPFTAGHWNVAYRGSGSGNGFAELVKFGGGSLTVDPLRVPFVKTDNTDTLGLTSAVLTEAFMNRVQYVNGSGVLIGPGNPANPGGSPTRSLTDGTYTSTSPGNPLNDGVQIDIAVLDVPSRWFVQIAGTPADSRKPGDAGYGKNPLVCVDKTGATSTIDNQLDTLGDLKLAGTSGAVVGRTVYDTGVVYVPFAFITNLGTGVQQMTKSELRHFFATGRTVKGENLTAITRDKGSGTRNACANSMELDPSFCRGENIGPFSTTTDQNLLGPSFIPGNKSGSGGMEGTVQNARLGVGFTGADRGAGTGWLLTGKLEIVAVKDDLGGGTEYVRPTIGACLDNGLIGQVDPSTGLAYTHDGYRVGGPAAYCTIGNPKNNPAAYGGLGGPDPMRNNEAAGYINNITTSVSDFLVLGPDPTQFSPGEFLVNQFVLVAATDRVQDPASPASFISNPGLNQNAQDTARSVSVLKDPAFAAFGTKTLNGLVPARQTTGGPIYSDGHTTEYVNQGGSTVGYGSPLTSRNRIAGDFSGDGKRDINDATEMIKAYRQRALAGPTWTAPNGTGAIAGAPGSDAVIEILGDFNGDGNFNKQDLYYWADGLGVNASTGALNRAAAFAALDTAFGGNVFGTTLATGKTYATGDSAGDVAGSGHTPGYDFVGHDGVVDAKDIDYVYKNFGDWSVLADAIRIDLSADINGDLKVDQADVQALVVGILGTSMCDVNLDGVADQTDLDIVMAHMGQSGGGWAAGDVNGDGVVDAADAAIVSGCLCVVDLNHDGLVDFSDYLEFLNLYDAQDLTVDFNQDGLVDFSDYLEFLNLYDAGC